jgi:hypothetical protein
MPENRSIFLYSSWVIVAGLAAHLLAPRCETEQTTTTNIADAGWGTISNLSVQRTKDGDLFEATSATGYHRILRTTNITEPGRYRVSIETQLDATPHFAIEIGGQPGQPYAFVTANMRTGEIESIKGTQVDAGSEPLGPGRFRWWVDQQYVPGRVDYDFTIMSNGNSPTFPGGGACRMILSNPQFSAVEK